MLSECELTILMPCLNEAETLARCIEKARVGLARVGLRGEVLVADNGSTDGSVAIAEKAGINLNIEPESLGVAEATSVSACSGKTIDREAFLNILLYRLDTFYASFL